ncbi:hypothetical protein OSB04_024065 [Centaurea solstitialis]|uniref:Integrase catalytic domain-containing protein n=1 Tax=Centaurea solstitialis TaxID=347529 RepID=A0AA38T4X4_9ASTR|nr:hypothetical protein OSB04_024065 [Centaurea solstitialis]
MTITSSERCLGNIFFSNSHLVISGSKIDLGEVSCSLQLIEQIIDAWQRVTVLDSDLVQLPVVDAHVKKSSCSSGRWKSSTTFLFDLSEVTMVLSSKTVLWKLSLIGKNFSSVRTPQQNGVAERRNRTLIEAARSMLIEANLATQFWAEAVNTACYTQNRSLIVKHFRRTPYELFRNRKPSIEHLHIFGCVCYILNNKDNLGKFVS